MTTLPKGPTNNILVNLQGLSDPIGYTLRMRKRYGDPMSLPKMDGKPVLATGSVEGLRSVFAVPPEALDQMLAGNFSAVFGESSLLVLSGARHTAMRNFLGHAPAVLRRLQDELTALGADPEPEALAKAPYLEAVCNETLRLRPPSPGVGRKLNAPMQIAGCELPAGAGVFAQIIWAHHDPAVFPEPEVFRPERFLERTYSPFEFLPFGGGHRRCIGAAFALYEMKLILGTLLRRYSFELVSKKPVRVGLQGLPGSPVRVIVR